MNDPNLPIPGAPSCDALAPFTRTPPNNRGQQTLLRPPKGPFVDEPSKALAVVETRTDGVGRAELIGVQLGIRLEKGAPVDFKQDVFILPSVIASLKWGIGSVEFAAECDWLHGTQIGLLAETVSVAARYVKNTRPWDPTPDDDARYPSFIVSAGVAYGMVNRNSSGARLTKIVQLENPDDEVDIPVPPFAVSFTVIPMFGAVAASVRAFGAYTADYSIAAPLSNAGQRNVENNFPLFNGAEFVTVKNILQAGHAAAAVVFGLAL